MKMQGRKGEGEDRLYNPYVVRPRTKQSEFRSKGVFGILLDQSKEIYELQEGTGQRKN